MISIDNKSNFLDEILGIYSGTSNHILFLFHLLVHLIESPTGRREFFHTREADSKLGGFGHGWERAVEQKNENRLGVICKYLFDLPRAVSYQVLDKFRQGYGKEVMVSAITQRGAELAEVILSCIGTLMREDHVREVCSHIHSLFPNACYISCGSLFLYWLILGGCFDVCRSYTDNTTVDYT